LIATDVSFGTLNYAILLVYLAAMVGIGLLFAGRQKSTEDYFLAGRNMPWLVVGMSMFASVTSASSYIGIPGIAYEENISLFVMGLVGIIVAPILIVVIYPFYRSLNVTTSYEYILSRYGAAARFTVSTLFLLARLGWLGVVLYAPAMMLSVVTGINLYVAILLMGVLATTYTIAGGLSAVLWTDVFQFVILIAGAVWVAVTLCVSVPGGAAGIMEIAGRTGHIQVSEWRLNLFEMSGMAVGFSYFFQLMQDYGTDQVTVQRLMAVKTSRGMAKAIMFNALTDVLVVGLLLFLGLGLYAHYVSFPEKLVGGISGDRILPYYIIHELPTGVSGLLVSAIFAAAMSSMDSGVNSMSTVLVCDFVRPLRKLRRSEQHDVRLARLLTLLLGTFATGVAFYVSRIENIFKASSSFLGLFAGPILALFLMGMLTRRANFSGWLIGVFVSLPTTLWLQHGTEVHFIYYFPFSFGICAFFGYFGSVLIGTFMGWPPTAEGNLTIWRRS